MCNSLTLTLLLHMLLLVVVLGLLLLGVPHDTG
jgi:hypothetical protein